MKAPAGPLAVGFLLASALLAGVGIPGGAGPREERYQLEIKGRPALYGHVPFTYVVIETVDGSKYYVHPDQQEEIRELPPKLYLFRGRIQPGPPTTIEAAQFPDGTFIVEDWEEVEASQ